MKPEDVPPIYIPTTRYDNLSCSQLQENIQSTRATIADMGHKLQAGDYDKSGALVVTPFFLMYDDTKARDETPRKAQELGRLKGTLMSMKEAATKHGCSTPG
jgi:hypothetical protein